MIMQLQQDDEEKKNCSMDCPPEDLKVQLLRRQDLKISFYNGIYQLFEGN